MQPILDDLAAAGIPLRDKISGGIVHWKLMLFAGQDTVQFSAANYSAFALVPVDPYVNYIDEVVYFTDQPSLVDSFKTRFDDVWTIDGEPNFVPWGISRPRASR